MKRNYIAFIVCALLVSAGCSDSSRERLMKSADEINAASPMNLGNGIWMDSAEYEGDNFTIVYKSDEEYANVKSIEKASKASKNFMATYLTSLEGKALYNALNAAGANLTMLYVGKQSNDTAKIVFTSADLKSMEADAGREKSDLEQLNDIVAMTVAQCPVTIDGDDFVMTDVIIDENNMTFYYRVNPEKYDFSDDTLSYRDLLYKGLEAELSAPANAMQLRLMKKLGVGVKYVIDSGDDSALLIFQISSDEVKSIH